MPISHNCNSCKDCEDAEFYPEMPMTIAGWELPSFSKHQLSFVFRRSASSTCSCWKIGRPLQWSRRTILPVFCAMTFSWSTMDLAANLHDPGLCHMLYKLEDLIHH